MSSKRKKINIGAAVALALMIPVIIALTPALLGATMILDQTETFQIGSNSYYATLNIQVNEVKDGDGNVTMYEYGFTLSNDPGQPGFLIFAMSMGWGVSAAPVYTVQASDVLVGSGDVPLRTPPVDDANTLSTRIYGMAPLPEGQTFDTALMYFAPGELTEHHLSLTTNKGSSMILVEYTYPESSIPEPGTLLLLAGAVFTLGLLTRRRKMLD